MPFNLRRRTAWLFPIIRKIRSFYRTINLMPTRAYDWLYARNLPKRFLRRLLLAIILIAYSIFLIVAAAFLGAHLGLSFVSTISNLVSNGIGSVLQALYSFGARFTLINPSELVTFIFAEAIFAFNAFLVKIIFFRKSSHGPRLVMMPGPTETDANGNQVFCIRVDNEYGDRAARGCQAQLIIEDLEDRDTEGLPVDASKYINTDLRRAIETDLKWKGTDGYDATIRAERHADLEVLRFVPERNGTTAHFDVPSEKGWEFLSASLHTTKYYLEVSVFPVNGKPRKTTFSTRRIKGNWMVD